MKCLTLLAGIMIVSLGFCASEKPKASDPTAIIVDGYCTQNRAARAPVALYSTSSGKAQVEEYLKKTGDEMPVLQLTAENLARVRSIAFGPDNGVESTKVNFFLRFFDGRGESGTRALTRQRLKEVIDALPESVRIGLLGMYEHG